MQKFPCCLSLPVRFHRPVAEIPRRGSVLSGLMYAVGLGTLCEDRHGQFVPSGARHQPARWSVPLRRCSPEEANILGPGHHAVLSQGIGQLPSIAAVSRFFERALMNPKLFGYGFETHTRKLRTWAWKAAENRNPTLAPQPRTR